MNLRNNQITVKEILENPEARALLHKRFPKLLTHPMAGPAQSLTLAQALEFAKVLAPQSVINELLRELQKL
ncbi:hypothetical protein SDC9_111815 [bioreactor metagenome]|uniref:Uncharacterized protein n=1 Tax=bioreactor metagenome TaxID=1076179 RepID=A0A645BT09_9ZZZZ